MARVHLEAVPDAEVGFDVPDLPFALIAAGGVCVATALQLWVNRPRAGAARERRRTIAVLLLLGGLCFVGCIAAGRR